MSTQENTENPVELDRKDLKILAYKDTVARLQEENADLRVELTSVIQQYNELATQVAESGTANVEEPKTADK